MVSRTAAANATAVALGAGPFVLTSVKVRRYVGAAALFLQIFDNNAPTVGTTAPYLVLPIPLFVSGMPEVNQKYPFAGNRGGVRMRSGLSYAVTTTPGGLTDPIAGEEPTVEMYYEPGN